MPGTAATATSATSSAFWLVSRPAERECGAVELQCAAKLVARRQHGQRRRGIGQNGDPGRVDAPAQRDPAQVLARAEDVDGAPEARSRVRRKGSQADAAGHVLELLQRARVYPPERRVRSYASSATSFTMSGRRAAVLPAAARRTMLVA